jgi:ABC-type phosphate transport system permease subunit
MPIRAARSSSGLGDRVFALICQAAGILVLVLLGALIIELFIAGLPAFRAFGIAFVTSTEWDPVQELFGAGVSIYGTIVTAVLAIVLAVPLAFGVAFFLTELAPPWMRRPVGTAVELLAAVPSIIYGMWGFFVIAPAFAQNVQPWIIDNIGEWPVIGFLFQGAPFGTGLFTAAFILAIMVLPFIAATMRDPAWIAEAERVENRDRTGAHREDVAQNAADTGCGALKWLDSRRVVVALDLEGHTKAIADVDDARVFAGTLQNGGTGRWKTAQNRLRMLVAAVLAPQQ